MGALSLAARPGRGVSFRRLDTESHTCSRDAPPSMLQSRLPFSPTLTTTTSATLHPASNAATSRPPWQWFPWHIRSEDAGYREAVGAAVA